MKRLTIRGTALSLASFFYVAVIFVPLFNFFELGRGATGAVRPSPAQPSPVGRR